MHTQHGGHTRRERWAHTGGGGGERQGVVTCEGVELDGEFCGVRCGRCVQASQPQLLPQDG